MLKKTLFSYLNTHLIIIVLGINFLAVNAQADETNIYKHTNEQGVVEFTDLPNQTNKPVHIPPMNTFKQKPIPRTRTPRKTITTPEAVKYTEFTITSPLNDTVVRQNAGNVTVALNLSPALQANHKTKVIIDNDEAMSLSGSSLIYTFSNISRGTHKAQAFIFDPQGKVLIESASVEFHLQRFAPIPIPPAPPKPSPKPSTGS